MNYSGSREVHFALLTSITQAIKAENPQGHAGKYCKPDQDLCFSIEFLFSFWLSSSHRSSGRVSGTSACPQMFYTACRPLFLVIWLARVLGRPVLIPPLSPFVHSCMHALNFNILLAATWLRLFSPQTAVTAFFFSFSFFYFLFIYIFLKLSAKWNRT